MIAQKTRYALRSLLFLAEEQGGAPVQLGRIAETQRVAVSRNAENGTMPVTRNATTDVPGGASLPNTW